MILFTNVAGDIILQFIEEIDLNATIYCFIILFLFFLFVHTKRFFYAQIYFNFKDFVVEKFSIYNLFIPQHS
jgi:hypothetical protein